MKFFEVITRAVSKVWRFISTVCTIGLVAVFVLLAIALIMPDNLVKVIEIFKGIL